MSDPAAPTEEGGSCGEHAITVGSRHSLRWAWRPTVIAACSFVATFTVPFSAEAFDKLSCVSAHERSQELRQDKRLSDCREQLRICSNPSCPKLVRDDCVEWLSQVDNEIETATLQACGEPKARAGASAPVGSAPAWNSAPHSGPRNGVELPDDRAHCQPKAVVAVDAPVSVIEEDSRKKAAAGRRVTLPNATAVPGTMKAAPHLPRSDPGIEDTPAIKSRTPNFLARNLLTPFVTGTLSMLAFGGGAYFGYTAWSDAQRLKDTCSPNCAVSQVSAVRTKLVLADFSTLAGVGFGAMTVWLIWDGRRNGGAPPPAEGISASYNAGSLGLQYSGRF